MFSYRGLFYIFSFSIVFWQCQKTGDRNTISSQNISTEEKIKQLQTKIKEKQFRGIEAIDLAQQSVSLAISNQDSLLINRSNTYLAVCIHTHYSDSAFKLIERALDYFIQNQYWNDVVDASRFLSMIYEENNRHDTASYILKHAIILADSINYIHGSANAQYNLASLENKNGENSTALVTANEALKNYKILNDLTGQTDVHNLLGIIYDQMGYYPEALEQYLQAKEFAKALNDIPLQIKLANNIGVLHDNLDNRIQALLFYNEALELANLSGDIGNQALLLNNLSYIHLENGDTLQTYNSLWNSIKLSEKDDFPCFDIYPLEGLIDLHIKQKNFDSAFYYLNYSFNRMKVCNDVAIEAPLYKHLSQIKQNQKDYIGAKNALLYSLKISKKAQLLLDQKEALYRLFQLNKHFLKTDEALYYLEIYHRFIDSVDTKHNSEKALALFRDYEFKKQIEVIENDNRVKRLEQQSVETKRKLLNVLFISVLLLSLIFVLVVIRLLSIARKRNKNLELLNEEKNTLIGIVSHDLKNPLNLIKGFIGLIKNNRNTVSNEEFDEYLNVMEESTNRMKEIIDRTLDISEIENLKIALHLQKLDIQHELLKAKERFKWIAEEKEIELLIEPLASQKLNVFVDPSYLNQIIDNLLSNAIKFSPLKKKVIISFGFNKKWVYFSIKDEGPGIPTEEVGELFKKFKLLSPKPTNYENSTGLGLSIVKKYVDAMHGSIEINTTLGQGSTFIISFPKG